MISFESFSELVNLLDKSYEECERVNENINSLTSNEDTRSMYLKPYDLVAESFIRILENEGESKEGAEWFVFEALFQIKSGGTEIEENGKCFKIKTIKDYYDYLKYINC